MTVDATPSTERDVAALENMLELAEEALIDVQMRLDDVGWAKLGDPNQVFSRDELRIASRTARIMAVADPLIRRAINLRIAYVWGSGVSIQARQEDEAGQDLNAVVQAFLDDPSNQTTFTSGQAREELERRFATGGDNFDCLVTAPVNGRVQVRNIPVDEVEEIVSNPEDAADPWFYKRVYAANVVDGSPLGSFTRRQTITAYYPALGYWPRLRPSSLNSHPIHWDKPVLHTFVNRPEGSPWGVGDVYAALPWARGYKEFLEDWARLVKALSRFAFRATAKNRPGAAKVRSAITAAPVDGHGQVGQTVIQGEGQTFEAIGKSGATIDSESGRPMAAMVASGTDIPVTILLADPGVTGARATAETLDRPTELIMQMRRDLHGARLRRILDYVIDQAVKAPSGSLRGTRTVDQLTGREIITLAGGQDRSIEVQWPDLSQTSIDLLVKAIVEADGTGKLPPLTVASLLLNALGVDDADEVLSKLVDDAGNFIDPTATTDAATAAAATKAFRDGKDPAAALT